MKLTQYIPAYVDVDERKSADFSSLQELLAVSWVRTWMNYPNFHQFSYNARSGHLMAEYDGGADWWVVGHLSARPVGLPDWCPLKAGTNVPEQEEAYA